MSLIDSLNNGASLINYIALFLKKVFLWTKNRKHPRIMAIGMIALVSFVLLMSVAVYRKSLVKAVNISLSQTECILAVGDRNLLHAKVFYSDGTNDGDVFWETGNENIAIVSNEGEIVGLGSGDTDIYAYDKKRGLVEKCRVEVGEKPSGYTIEVSKSEVLRGEVFNIYVRPLNDDYTEIIVHAKSPSGKINSYTLGNKGYYIDTETGKWLIYSEIINKFGTYIAQKDEDFVSIYVK